MKNKTPPEANFDKLRTTLLNSKLQKDNPAAFQVINQLLDTLGQNNANITSQIESVMSSIPGGGGSLVSPSNTVEKLDGTNVPGISLLYSRGDHKHDIDPFYTPILRILSDGGIPNALPVNDGAGNFVYVLFT